MKTNWRAAMAATVLSVALIGSSVPAMADDAPAAAVVSSASYSLNESMSAVVKSVSVNRTSGGLQIGALVGLTNNTGAMARVPDYEVRVKTTEGTVYTLQASSANARSLMAQESAELTYMVTVDRPTDAEISELSFVEVDEYTYPKTEKVLLNVPVTSSVWYGTKGELTDPSANIAWGETFSLPSSSSPLRYTPVEMSKQNDANGYSYLITVLADNQGTGTETVPDFRLDGKTADKTYAGKRVEQEPVTLAAGEKKYVHFSVTLDQDVSLQSLLLMTTEAFVPAGGASSAQGAAGAGAGSAAGGAAAGSAAGASAQTQPGFDVARLIIAAPTPSSPSNTAGDYTIGSPIAVDPLNHLIDSKTEVSLVELHMHENEGEGFKSVVAKFKISNKSDMTVATPAFQTELVGGDGSSYAGTRQSTTAAELMPNLGYVVSYSFMIPASESGETMTMKLLDNVTAAPYSSTIANFNVAVQKDTDDSLMSFYPFNVKLDDWTLSAFTNTAAGGQGLTYSYKLKLWLTVNRLEDVVVDQNFSKFKVELVDSAGRSLGSQTVPFTGDNKLVSGEQTIDLSNIKTDQVSSPITVKLYESIDTPNGEATRLVKTLVQP
ncbi:hypothetical protein N0M98_02365 [Paenibacillus doosanensis]|uniref:hypothetical protein n=1 Tax=Paenibacillus doosanensis TaxID=1229154 RepID=UPI00217FBE0E|nr:hypothetical protein [Paenibacillus doosanensis]MCS7458974.1 hypothetical protein [Paenibacillus doosanensis]